MFIVITVKPFDLKLCLFCVIVPTNDKKQKLKFEKGKGGNSVKRFPGWDLKTDKILWLIFKID